MPGLKLDPNFSDADAFYAALTELHRNCDEGLSERINARLLLLLANHVGDAEALHDALRIAGEIKEQSV